MSTVSRLSPRLRDERGITLPEVLVAITIGIAIVTVIFLITRITFNQTAKVTDRVEAVQRGRIAMDRITRQFRSQVCPATTGAALTSGEDDSVTLYTDSTGGAQNPERHTIAYDGTRNTITQYDYVGTGTWPNLTFPATPARTRELITNVVPVSGTPIFSYYTFTTTGTITPSVRLNTPLADPDLARVVRTDVSFVVRPRRTNQPPQSTTFQNQVDVRTADPNKPTESPRCL